MKNEYFSEDADRLERTAAAITQSIGEAPRIALILGSAFQRVASAVSVEIRIGYKDLPGFPRTMVPGHAGEVLCGRLGGARVLICCGRAHYYQGYSMDEASYIVRVMGRVGVKDLILTNAAGGLNPAYRPGDFMLLSDHINFAGANPLRGVSAEGGKCFVDLTDAYSKRLGLAIKRSALKNKIRLREGVYVAVSGPSYETPAEIRAFRKWGADAVGMSTVPEVLMARYIGLEVAAIACITNPAAGMRRKKLSHEEVLAVGEQSGEKGVRLLEEFMAEYRRDKAN